MARIAPIQHNPHIIDDIKRAFGNEEQFKDFMKRSSRGIMLQQINVILAQHFRKADAQLKSKQFFEQVVLQNFSKTQLVCSYLRNHALFDCERQIKDLINRGKPKRVLKQLIQNLGQQEGERMFKFAEHQIRTQPQQPILGSIKIKEEKGLEVYLYPQSINRQNKENVKNVIVFGETGSGKSTFLNAICNYLSKVQIDDNIRYKFVIDKANFHSQTTQVRDYYITDSRNKKEKMYRLIDTPGFGDTKGFTVDQKTIQQIKLKLKELNQLHTIIFTMKSTQIRLNQYQKYVILSVINLLPKKCIPNILFVLTFSDGGKSTAADILRSQFIDYSLNIREQKFIKVNSSCIFDGTRNEIQQIQWLSTYASIKLLLRQINHAPPMPMNHSERYFKHQEDFATILQELHSKFDLVRMCEREMILHLDSIVRIQLEVERIQMGCIKRQVQYRQFPTGHFVLRCINCKQINCHLQCHEIDNNKHPSDPQCCEKISKRNGLCSVCGCHQTLHKRIKRKILQFEIKIYQKTSNAPIILQELQIKFSESVRNFEYYLHRYCCGYQQMLTKRVQMDSIKSRIEMQGMLRQNDFIEAKEKYVELILKTQKPTQKEYKRLNLQLRLLHQSLCNKGIIIDQLNTFKAYIKQSKERYQQTRKSRQFYRDIVSIIEDLIRLTGEQRQINLQRSNFTQNLNQRNQNQQDKCVSKQCCYSCFRCIFCCFFD